MLVKHDYNGQTFKVAKGLSARERDNACALLLAYQSRAKGKTGETYFEVERMPESAIQSPPKPRGRPRKVIEGKQLPDTPENRAAVAELTVDESVIYSESETRYAQGMYRVPCAECGKPIPLTGKRGRAPKYHEACRPTE